MQWAICTSCLDRCSIGMRQREYEEGGMKPPNLQPESELAPCGPPKTTEHADATAIFDSLRSAYVAFDEDDTDADEEEQQARHAAFQVDRIGASKTSVDPGVTFKPLPKGFGDVVNESLFTNMSDHHSHALERCVDLRRWPLAQLHHEEKRVELGASLLQWASFHGYVTMETEVVSLTLSDEYDITKFPLKIDFSQHEEYNASTRTHGKEALTFCTWVCAHHGQRASAQVSIDAHSLTACLLLQDVVDFKENRPRELWLQLLAWRLLDNGLDDEAWGRVQAQREFVRERIVNHVRYVRPTVSLMRCVQDESIWQKMDERAVELINFGRCSYTQKDWNKLYRGYDKAVDAPFLTRIPWGCPAQFQLAPNVTSLSSSASNMSIDAPAAGQASARSAAAATGLHSKPLAHAAAANLFGWTSSAEGSGSASGSGTGRTASSMGQQAEATSAAGFLTAGGQISHSGSSLSAGALQASSIAAAGRPVQARSRGLRLTCAASQQDLHDASTRKARAPWNDASKETLWQILRQLHFDTVVNRDDMKLVIQHKDFPLKAHYNSRDNKHLKSLHNICLDLINKKVEGARDNELAAQRKTAAAHKKKDRFAPR